MSRNVAFVVFFLTLFGLSIYAVTHTVEYSQRVKVEVKLIGCEIFPEYAYGRKVNEEYRCEFRGNGEHITPMVSKVEYLDYVENNKGQYIVTKRHDNFFLFVLNAIVVTVTGACSLIAMTKLKS